MAKSNPRYECTNPSCNAKVTRNQLRINNGICIYCKTPMNHTDWLGGQTASLAQMISLPASIDKELKELAVEYDIPMRLLIYTSVVLMFEKWKTSENTSKSIKDDLMLAKLMTL